MHIVWDEPKRLKNLQAHGLDFADLRIDFFLTADIRPSYARRATATGLFESTMITVVFSRLGREAISLISMRHSSRKERRLYEKED